MWYDAALNDKEQIHGLKWQAAAGSRIIFIRQCLQFGLLP